MNQEYTNVKAVIDRVVFYNTSSKWGVLSIRNPFEKDPIFLDKKVTLSGNFEEVYAGCEIIFSGKLESNPKYGFQIKISTLQINRDIKGKEAIINFLVKSSIKGISVANATKIYNKFGDDSIHVVLHEPHKIKSISGIGESTYEDVVSSIADYLRMEDLIKFCTNLGINFNVIYKLDREFGDEALSILKSNIYSIIEVTDEFSFNTIDEIALKSGYKKEDKARLRAAMIYCVKNHVMMSSSTGISVSSLKSIFLKVTGLSNQMAYSATIATLVNERLVVIDGSFVYWKYYYDKEEFSSRMLYYLSTIPLNKPINQDIVTDIINSFPFQLNKQQIDAVNGVIQSRIAVITGGPGTGKSTITKAVVDIFKKSKVNFKLLSPTGKATRRMVECTKHEAYTIHKYLHAKSASLDDVELPVVPQDTAIIIDESSMLDILMLAKLLEIAKFTPIRLILIGDCDQLPSVQVGNVLEDIINSGIANVYKLTDIMRQAKDSHIIQYCADINNGSLIKQCEHSDFEYLEFFDTADLFDELQTKYFEEVNRYGVEEVQVITPYKKGDLGTLNLNKFISSFNPNERGEHGYAVNDKIMQIRNDYNAGLFNGECGIVTDTSIASVTASFSYDEKTATTHSYDNKNLSDIMLAHAATCHKSQGAEYSVVFVILDSSNGDFLLTRRLLYTAVSRGKKKVYIYSTESCVPKCIRNTSEVKRITKLRELVKHQNKLAVSLDNWEIEEVPF